MNFHLPKIIGYQLGYSSKNWTNRISLRSLLAGIALTIICSPSIGQDPLIEVEGGLKIGNTTVAAPDPGTIRFNGSAFEGWNGLTWVTLGNFKLAGTVTDIDGNEYKTVEVGTLVWMAENLRVTHYNNGENMQIKIGNSTINFGSHGTLHYPNDLVSNAADYGALYNYTCIENNNICPIGWHMPYDGDWEDLRDAVGGQTVGGSQLREVGTEHWLPPNSNACNAVGFTARGAGFWSPTDNDFLDFKETAYWWSIVPFMSTLKYFYIRNYSDAFSYGPINNHEVAFSVRCVKD